MTDSLNMISLDALFLIILFSKIKTTRVANVLIENFIQKRDFILFIRKITTIACKKDYLEVSKLRKEGLLFIFTLYSSVLTIDGGNRKG